ncbi:MAG TPA: hypothetical protein PKH37_04285 [Alphaproteobacteria bacterium]|nr:hypothetical protein [Alphaproteobacteria bacterium]
MKKIILALILGSSLLFGCGGSEKSSMSTSEAGKILSDAAHKTVEHTKETLSEAGRTLQNAVGH